MQTLGEVDSTEVLFVSKLFKTDESTMMDVPQRAKVFERFMGS